MQTPNQAMHPKPKRTDFSYARVYNTSVPLSLAFGGGRAETFMALFAVDAVDVDRVADELEAALRTTLQRRDSSYWGKYRIGPVFGGEVRVYPNRDPLYRAEADSPDEEFFEPEFSSRGVLVGVYGPAEAAVAVGVAMQSFGRLALVRQG